MMDTIIVRCIAICVIAGLIVYLLILACAELMGGVMSEDDEEDR